MSIDYSVYLTGVALELDPSLVKLVPPKKEDFILRPDIALKCALNAHRSFTVKTADAGPLPSHKLALWDGEERFIPPGHPAQDYVARTYGPHAVEIVSKLQDDPRIIFGVPILEVEDVEGLQLRHVHIEPRVFHKDCPERLPVQTMVVLPELSLIHCPRCLSLDPAKAMLHATPDRGGVERRAFLKAREAVETADAFAAFELLFRHYSLNEELCRLDEWMKLLPWTLEEHPGVQRYRDLLETQIGHLRGGARQWYEKESPHAGIELELYVQGICVNPTLLPVRLRWLIEASREKGHKRVAEFGSIEGVSLFHLIQMAPDIEWHGFEVNPKIVAIGNGLAEKAGLLDRFNLHVMGEREHARLKGTFDAVALFEALEHNDEKEGAELLKQAEDMVRPGGDVFVTTPWGNWSAHDEKTRDLELRKDHVQAYTVPRMEKFLHKHARMVEGSLQVGRVINPSLHEYNSWVHSRWVKP